VIEFLVWQGHDAEFLLQRATRRQIQLFSELAQNRLKQIYGSKEPGRGRGQ
jgi:hypothetical protein